MEHQSYPELYIQPQVLELELELELELVLVLAEHTQQRLR
jgi:hypothetical protein